VLQNLVYYWLKGVLAALVDFYVQPEADQIVILQPDLCIMKEISAVVITFNEENNIGRCLDSIRRVADDILVVDSYSNDDTKRICMERGVRFVERVFTTYAEQKNFGVALAKHDHILSLDADEYLSPELEQSILEVKESWPAEAFRMNRLSSYGGKWVRHGSWYPDKQMRLWNRKVGHWNSCNPHEKVQLDKGVNIVQLKGDLLHRSYENAEASLHKIQLYSTLYARSNKRKKNITVMGIILHTGFAFVKSFMLKRGFMDGYTGLAVAMSVANHTFYKYAKLYEANRKEGKQIVITKPVSNEEGSVSAKAK
jgi:glycosyltransferase involved in cell wall biosynthesis